MKLERIQKEVISLVDDRGYDSITVIEYINKALYQCSLDIDIPEFKRVTNIKTITGQAYAYLNEQILHFGGRVRRVKYAGADLKVYVSLDNMLDNFDDLSTTGTIEAVALEGRVLWYAKIPENPVTLLVLYFEHPEPFKPRVLEEVPWMPEACQLDILVNGAAWKIWEELEEEDSGYPMARRFHAVYNKGIKDFKQWITRNRLNLTYSHWSN